MAHLAGRGDHAAPRRRRAGRESLTPFHPPPGSDLAAHGGHPPGRDCCLPRAPGVGAAAGRLPNHPGVDLLSGREPRRHDLVGHRTDGASVWADPRSAADELHKLLRRLDDHPAVRSEAGHRRRRAGGAGRHQRRGELSAARPSQPADLQQGESSRYADHHAGAHVDAATAEQGRGPRRHHPRAEDLAAPRRRPRHNQWRPETGRACAGQSIRPGVVRLEPRGPAHRIGGGKHRPGQGKPAGTAAELQHRRERPDLRQRRLQAGHHRLSQRRAGTRGRCGARGRRRGGRAEGGVDEHHACRHHERPAATGREHHQRRRPHRAAPAPTDEQPAAEREGHGAH